MGSFVQEYSDSRWTNRTDADPTKLIHVTYTKDLALILEGPGTGRDPIL